MGYLPYLPSPPSLIGRLRAQMQKRPVDLGTRDSTLVFANERRRPGEGDPDALREAVPAGEKPPVIPSPPLRVEVKGPLTTEIEPWLSLEVRAGVRG